MLWEYRQLIVNTQGWIEQKMPDDYIDHLNRLALQGWEVNQMIPIHTGISGTSTVVILLKRALNASVES
jgi:hypothetical protein